MSALVNDSTLEATIDKAEQDAQDQALDRFGIFAMVLYTIITVCALIGNSLFCYVLLSSRGLRTVTYRLLFNLSLSDILIACLSGAGHMTHTWIIQHWPFGEFCCYSFGYLQVLVILASSYTLVVISFERYMSILHPLRTVIPRNNAGYIITTIWLVAGLASIPEPIFYLHGTYEDFQPSGNSSCSLDTNLTAVNGSQQLSNGTTRPSDFVGDKNYSYSTNENICNETVEEQVYYCAPNPGEAGGHYYSLFICLFQYFIPVAIMGYCYAMVANTMWRSRNTLSGRQHSTRFTSSRKNDQTKNQQNSFSIQDSARKQSMTKGGQKMIKMLIVVVACFSICWFPHEVYWVLKFPFPQLSTFPADPYIFTVFHMLALSHACFNPIICCWMNSSVRHGFMCTFGNIRLFRACFPKTHWERYQSTKRNALLHSHTEVMQCTVKRREGGSRRSAFLTSENANNNILKGNRRISSNSSMSTAVSTPSFRSSYSAGSTRMGSKRVIATVNNASFRQGINRFH